MHRSLDPVAGRTAVARQSFTSDLSINEFALQGWGRV